MPLLPLGLYAIWWPALTHFTVDGFATTGVRPCASSATSYPCSTTTSAPTSTSMTPIWTASSSSTATVPSTPAPWPDTPGCTPPPSPASWTGSNAAAGSPASVTPATVAPSSSAPWATVTPSCSVSSRDEHRDGPALRQLQRRAPTARRLPPPTPDEPPPTSWPATEPTATSRLPPQGHRDHRVTLSKRFAVNGCVDPAAVLLEAAPRGHQPR